MWFAEVRATTKRGYGSASVAVKMEKRATKCDKIIVLFSETETAKQNQKFPFHFLSAPPTPPAEEKKEGKEDFWVLHTRVHERVRGALVHITAQSERTRQFQATTRSARAKLGVLLEMGSNFFKQTPQFRLMQESIAISRYNLWTIGLYVILFPLIWVFAPNVLNYNFSSDSFRQVLLITIGSFFGIFLLNTIFRTYKLKWQRLSPVQILQITLYALLFAIPEEIIFKGIIQGSLQNAMGNILMVVLISSVIFGVAHLPNGASGLRPRDWNWRFATATFLIGLPLGLIFAVTGSLLIPTLLHALLLVFFKLYIDAVSN